MDLVGLTRVICEYEFDKAGVRLQSMGTFSGLNPDRTDMRLGSPVLQKCRTQQFLVPTSKLQPFLSQSFYVPGCLAISVLARALSCAPLLVFRLNSTPPLCSLVST